MNEKEKYLKWYEEEKKKGLEDVKFFPNAMLGLPVGTEEEIYKELNEMNSSPGIVTGRYKAGKKIA